MSSSFKVACFTTKGGTLEIQERTVPTLKPNEVLIKVEACGVCHSDVLAQYGAFPGVTYPRTPGHEVIGRLAKLGADVKRFRVGDRVGVGWHGSHCFQCDGCATGDFQRCSTQQATGISMDGGYGEYVTCQWEALARVPDNLKAEEAAPLLCAGVTVYNALRKSNAKTGDVVVVQGIGGLGHLGIQFARKMGFKVIACSTGSDKHDLAIELGAHHYIDTSTQNAVDELKKFGGAKVVLTTSFDAKSMSSLMDGLSDTGTLLVAGADVKNLEVTPIQLILKRSNVQGANTGTGWDCEETLRFAAENGIRAMSEIYPLERAKEAWDRMMSNKQRFRVVLVPNLDKASESKSGGATTAGPTKSMGNSAEEKNKRIVLEAFDTLFNKRDYDKALTFWSPHYIQHSAHIGPGRDSLFGLIKAIPPTLKYENQLIVANGDFVMLHGRFSGNGLPAAWVVVDVVRMENGVLAEHWDVIQDEASQAESKSGSPMFGKSFPTPYIPGTNWMNIIRANGSPAFKNFFTPSVTLESSVLSRSLIGVDQVSAFFTATAGSSGSGSGSGGVYENFQFTKEYNSFKDGKTVIEWKANVVGGGGGDGGLEIGGVTLLTTNAMGLIESILIYHRPFVALSRLAEELTKRLDVALASISASSSSSSESKTETKSSIWRGIAVIGGTGNVGNATAVSLAKYQKDHKTKHTISIGSRDPNSTKGTQLTKLGLKVGLADMGKPDTVLQFCKGHDVALLNTPSDMDRVKLTCQSADAAKRAGVKHIVLVSIPEVETNTIFGKQFAEIENHIKKLGVPWTFVRLPMFADNFLCAKQNLLENGVLSYPVKAGSKFDCISVDECGEFFAALLAGNDLDKYVNTILYCSGPAPTISHTQVVKWLGEAVNNDPKAFKFVQVKAVDFLKNLTGMGWTETRAKGLYELYELMDKKDPCMSHITTDFKNVVGREPQSVADW